MNCRYIHFETTSLCNLKCISCPVNVPGELKRDKKLLDFGLFKRIIDECDGLEIVGLNNWGEPLLHPNIIEMISFCSNKGLVTKFATNAVLMTYDVSESLIESGLSEIKFSIDGLPETYKKIRGVDFSLVESNIDYFLKLNKGRVKTSVVCTIQDENKNDIFEVTKYWKDKVDNIQFQPRILFAETKRTSICPEVSKNHMVVLSDGDVVPCCSDYNKSLKIGNINTSTIDEIFNGDELKKLREEHMKGYFKGACLLCKEYETDNIEKRF